MSERDDLAEQMFHAPNIGAANEDWPRVYKIIDEDELDPNMNNPDEVPSTLEQPKRGDILPAGVEMTQVDPDMLGRKEINNRFGFHRAAIEGPQVSTQIHADLREAYIEFAEYLDALLPSGREKELCFDNLESSSMWSHKAVAQLDPLETTGE